MGLLDYTTYNEIRATLGVNDTELSDETLGLAMYSSNLSAELDDISMSLRTRYAALQEINADALTVDQARLLDYTRMFGTLTVAKQLCGSVSMFGTKEVTDAKAGVSRWSNDPYKEMIKSVKSSWEVYRLRVAAALDVLTTSPTVMTRLSVFAVSTPDVDPVVG